MIYKTRAAIERAIRQFENSALQKVFIWYGNLFLRVTHAVSRRQEFIADEVAAGVSGAAAMAAALRRVHGAALGFQTYWHSELGPVLNSGYLPPITAGFARFMATERVHASVQRAVQTEEAEGQGTEFDTHPPLRERVAALAALPQGSEGDTRPAVSLLSNPSIWERRVLGVAVNDDWARSLQPVEWENVIETVYLKIWRATVKENARNFRQLTPATLEFAGALAGAPKHGAYNDREEALLTQIQVTAVAVSLALYELGWTATTLPGEEIVLRRDGHEVRPFRELVALAEGGMTMAEWTSRCEAMGFAHVPLAGAAVL